MGNFQPAAFAILRKGVPAFLFLGFSPAMPAKAQRRMQRVKEF